MSSPLGLTTNLAQGFIPATQSQTADNTQTVGYNYKGYNFKKYSTAPNVQTGKETIFSGRSTAFKSKFEHSNDVYDLRTTSIINYCNNPLTPAMRLKSEDFAYLKDLGVYPNNRLIIVRRFPAPVGNDLTTIKTMPISTLISWIPDSEPNFIKVTFGEDWGSADTSLKKLLNEVGNDMSSGKENKSAEGGGNGSGLGGVAGKLIGDSLPGFMEGIQLNVLKNLGYVDNDAKSIPSGNPNIIKQAKVRTTIKDDEDGSGLKCAISILFETEYEQKFIDGVDPTLVYLDVIANVLRFGTSESKFIINTKLKTQGVAVIDKIQSGDWIGAISLFVSALLDAMLSIANQLVDSLKGVVKAVDDALKSKEPATNITNTIIDTFLNNAANTIISKYRVRLGGIISALSGEASTPWHVTVGNPKKPVFSSGDMLIDNVDVDFGNILAFNDLPSNIKIKFTLTNARNLGAQEIFERFNCGAGRTYIAKHNKFEESEAKISVPFKSSSSVEQQK